MWLVISCVRDFPSLFFSACVCVCPSVCPTVLYRLHTVIKGTAGVGLHVAMTAHLSSLHVVSYGPMSDWLTCPVVHLLFMDLYMPAERWHGGPVLINDESTMILLQLIHAITTSVSLPSIFIQVKRFHHHRQRSTAFGENG